MEGLIATGKVPEGGFESMQRVTIEDVMVALKINSSTFISESMYKWFIRLLFAVMYVFSVQGRQLGLSTLLYGSHQALIEHQMVQTNKLKTRAKHGYQNVVIDREYGLKLLIIYMQYVRTKVL